MYIYVCLNVSIIPLPPLNNRRKQSIESDPYRPPPGDRGLATPCSRSRTRQPTRRRKNNERGRERRSGVDGGSHVYRRAKGKSQTTLAGFQEGRRWLQIPRRQPRRTLFDSLFETAAPAFTAPPRNEKPTLLWSFRSSAHVYILYIYIYKFLLENEKFSEYLRARERVYTCVQRDVQPECIHALRHRARRY